MIDHILAFPDEAAAIKALPQFRAEDAWDTSRCIPGVTAYVVTGTHLDKEGNDIEDRDYRDGWRVNIALDKQDDELTKLAELVIDRDAAARGEPFVLASAYGPDELAAMTFSPVFAGSTLPKRLDEAKTDMAVAAEAFTDAGFVSAERAAPKK